MTTIRTFAGYTNLLFGHYKGIQSRDGDYFVFTANNASAQSVAFVYRVSTGTKYADITGTIGHAQVSTLGTYTSIGDGNDGTLVYNTATGALVQSWPSTGGAGQPSHADIAIDASGDEVLVGIGKLSSGAIIKRRFSDGAVTVLTPASPASYGQHCSTRCTRLSGWAFASAGDNGPGYPLYNEMVIAVKLDGSRVVQLCSTQAKNTQNDYYSTAYASPSPSGSRVIFGSNWGDPNGNGRPMQSYVCDFRGYPPLLS